MALSQNLRKVSLLFLTMNKSFQNTHLSANDILRHYGPEIKGFLRNCSFWHTRVTGSWCSIEFISKGIPTKQKTSRAKVWHFLIWNLLRITGKWKLKWFVPRLFWTLGVSTTYESSVYIQFHFHIPLDIQSDILICDVQELMQYWIWSQQNQK